MGGELCTLGAMSASAQTARYDAKWRASLRDLFDRGEAYVPHVRPGDPPARDGRRPTQLLRG